MFHTSFHRWTEEAARGLPSVFNCSNDMALAANVRQYVPPKRIRQMEADLAAVARVWEGTRMAGPWGWSLAMKQRYRQMGVGDERLPSDEWLAGVRRLSGRAFACGYLRQMLSALGEDGLLGGEMRYVEAMPPPGPEGDGRGEGGRLIFKLPWSSSGRGVFVGNWDDTHARARAQGFLSSQGGFVVDRFYADKVADFAMEFLVHENHEVEFLGYSVFRAAADGAYGYNYVESQEALLRRIGVDGGVLDGLVDYHLAHLGRMAYHGPVGVDMLKTADGRVHPCVEMNLRMNMGIVALLLHERYGGHASVALTPPRPQGFQAVVDEGRLRVVRSPLASHFL